MRSMKDAPWVGDGNARAMLICRISDRKQQDGVSLEAQKHTQERYARAAGLSVIEVVSFQESAKKSELRRQFHAALAKARAQRIKHLVFYVWDRIARNFTDAELLEEMVRDGDIVLHVATGGTVLHADSDDAEFFLFDISIAQAKQDNRMRKRKTIDGMVQRCRNGWFPGVPPTFYVQRAVTDEEGRVKRRGAVVAGPSPEGRALLRRQAELRMGGVSLPLIRETCLREGIVPPKLIPRYRVSLIERMLKNCFYAALPRPHDGYISQFEWRGQWYEGKHEPVYTADEWESLQRSFGLRTPVRKRKHEGLFTSTLRLTCADESCACLVTYAPKQKGGREYRYYRCSDGKHLHANQVNVTEEDILDQLGDAVDAIAVSERLAATIARALSETHRAATAAKRADRRQLFLQTGDNYFCRRPPGSSLARVVVVHLG